MVYLYTRCASKRATLGSVLGVELRAETLLLEDDSAMRRKQGDVYTVIPAAGTGLRNTYVRSYMYIQMSWEPQLYMRHAS